MKTKKTILIFLLILLIILGMFFYFNTSKCKTSFKKINSFKEVENIFKSADKNTLIIFDVDDTLIIPKSTLMRSQTAKKYLQEIQNIFADGFKDKIKDADKFLVKWLETETPLVIEPEIVSIIKSLQDKEVKVLALTSLSTGSHFTIKYLPKWRFDKLKEVGIDFSFVNIPDKEFTELKKNNDTYPVLYKGILATNQESKGKVLGAFLNYTNFKPNKIIFFDDNKNRIDEILEECCIRNIPAEGYQYLAEENLPVNLNADIAKYQLNYLIKNNIWLSDEEAAEKVIKKKK